MSHEFPVATQFSKQLAALKQSIGPVDFEWYPHDTMTALAHLDQLLTGPNRALFDGTKRILDVGCQDGDLSFFLESLGHQVVALDHPTYSHNGMRGVRALKAALGSAIELVDVDLDRQFVLPHERYDVAIFLGVLYHLRNPFYVLDELARRASYAVLSTRIARRFPNGKEMPRDVALAYLLGERELNDDETNYFIFSDAGLRTLLNRTYWDIEDYMTTARRSNSDPIRADRDERVFCLVKSRYDRLANVEMLDGWHETEESGWRWTKREFSVRLRWDQTNRARNLVVDLFVAEALLQQCPSLRIAIDANSSPLAPEIYNSVGQFKLIRALPMALGSEVTLHFQLSGAMPPDAGDPRERGVIVNSIRVE
jgi:tRNA (mo5U34)-methyltransferase